MLRCSHGIPFEMKCDFCFQAAMGNNMPQAPKQMKMRQDAPKEQKPVTDTTKEDKNA